MKCIAAMFRRLADQGATALIPYITAGDPDLKTTEALVLEMARRGADLIELGIPFSDPLADGPTIQAACVRALKQGVHLEDVLALVGRLRQETDIPLVLMGYYNPVLQYGLERLARDAAQLGVNGFIIPDLPGEQAQAWRTAALKEGVAAIFLAAPTSGPERIRAIGQLTRGFLYYVSVTGITGARTELPPELITALQEVRTLVKCPV
ncbi:MAG: tryptophan synthase subunit alpha, partial [Desulfobacca sp.]|nr:tryptophan synthase subunit alpha [Desulfobacca sp.]